MKILIVTPIFPPEIGGPATYVYEVSRRFKKTHQITVVAFAEEIKPIPGVKINPVRIKYSFLGPLLRQFNLFHAIIKNLRGMDLIYAQGPFVVGLMSFLAAQIYRKKLIIKFVGDLVWETAFGQARTKKFLDDFLTHPDAGLIANLKIKIQKFVFQRAKKVIVPSFYLKSILTKYYQLAPAQVEVIYNSIDFTKFKGISKNRKDANLNLITIGRLVNWKHIDDIIRALGRLKNQSAVLKIVGEGPELTKLKKLSVELDLQKQVKFLGRLSYPETLQQLADSDIFILNSNYEGLPHTVIEAMFLKIPVIATNIPGTTEIAIENKTALLVPKKSPADLAEKIRIISGNPALEEKLTDQAYKLVKQEFNWDQNLKKLAKIL